MTHFRFPLFLVLSLSFLGCFGFPDENGTFVEDSLRQSSCTQRSCQRACTRGQYGKCLGTQCYCYADYGSACGPTVTPGCGTCDTNDDICKDKFCSCRSCRSCNFKQYDSLSECNQNCFCAPKGTDSSSFYFSSKPKDVLCQFSRSTGKYSCSYCENSFYRSEQECYTGNCGNPACSDTGRTCVLDTRNPGYYICTNPPTVVNPEI